MENTKYNVIFDYNKNGTVVNIRIGNYKDIKIAGKSIDKLPTLDAFPYIKPKWNEAHPRVSGNWPVDEPPKPYGGHLVWASALFAKFFNKQKKEEKMKVNVEIAKICHEANRQYCIDNQLKTHAKWDELPLIIQNSIVAGVVDVIADPKITPTELHFKWCEYKEAEDWTKGDVKDLEAKTHPNLVKFKKLPDAEKRKVVLFITTVRREMKK